jgi:hypothetical protein
MSRFGFMMNRMGPAAALRARNIFTALIRFLSQNSGGVRAGKASEPCI